jgi:biopolymer transport protein ExbD/biopolymer transport protein TolR
MVIAPALEHGERVELPAMLMPDKQQKTKMDPITVTVGAGGSLYFEKERVEQDSLRTKLREAHDREPDRRVVLKGDSSLPYEKVRDVFVTTQEAGFAGIALMVEKRGGKAGKGD